LILTVSVITLFLTAVYAGLVLFFRRGWKRIVAPGGSVSGLQTRVSVIVAARNEEENIAETITDLLAQDYPPQLVEFIIVDDHSTDRTAEVVNSFTDPRIRLIRLNAGEHVNSYKKKAIADAIARAGGELIVTTDADCRMDAAWLSTVVSYYREQNLVMISSPVVYFRERNWFERMQTLEFLYLIGLGASSIGNKVPSTCNGANLAYKREVFLELGGFSGIDDLASGDDELLLHKVAVKYPDRIGFCKSRAAIVRTTAKPDLASFIAQRKRWASKSTRYKDRKIVVLGVSIWLCNLLLAITVAGGFFSTQLRAVAAAALLLKFLAELAFLVPVTGFARRKELLKLLPALTLIHIVYMIYIGIAGNSGTYVWKDRKVR
jgi:cellulose synthase/poly-beta-1,6-N-acetylglucosamine synthase-like glycosyltransferase